jgi:hypothetical protein
LFRWSECYPVNCRYPMDRSADTIVRKRLLRLSKLLAITIAGIAISGLTVPFVEIRGTKVKLFPSSCNKVNQSDTGNQPGTYKSLLTDRLHRFFYSHFILPAILIVKLSGKYFDSIKSNLALRNNMPPILSPVLTFPFMNCSLNQFVAIEEALLETKAAVGCRSPQKIVV